MRASQNAVATFRRWMLGVFGAMALAGLGAAYAVHAWMAAVDKQTPSLSIVGASTRGALHFRALPSRPQTRAMLDAAVQRLVQASRESERLPMLSRWMLSRAESQMIPTELTLAFSSAGAGFPPTLTGAVNLQGYPRVFLQVANAAYRWSSPSDGEKARDYRGSRLIGEHPTLSLKQGTLLLASDASAMERVLDTLQSTPVDETQVRAALDKIGASDDAIGVYENADDSLGAVLPLMHVTEDDARSFSALCARLQIGAEVEGPDRIRLSIALLPRGGASVPALRVMTARVVEQVARAASEGGLALTFQTSSGPTAAHAEVTLEGIQEVLARLLGLMAEVGIAATPSAAP